MSFCLVELNSGIKSGVLLTRETKFKSYSYVFWWNYVFVGSYEENSYVSSENIEF